MAKYTLQDEINRKAALNIPRNYGKVTPAPTYSAPKPATPSYSTPKPSPTPSYSTPKPSTPSYSSPKPSYNTAKPTPSYSSPATSYRPPSAQQSTPRVSTPPVMPKYNEQAQTNYGTGALGNILSLKKYYDQGAANQNSGLKGWASTNSGQYYSQLDPQEAAAVKGMNTQQLIDYINSKNQPTPQPQPTPEVAQEPVNMPAMPSYAPQQDAVYAPRGEQELRDMSGDSLAIERAALQKAVTEKLNSLRNAAQYSNKLLQDQRVLENANMERTLNPFAGKTSYDKAMVNRGRGIDDAARLSELENHLNATQEEIFNFDKLAPERQRQIYNELLKYERDFGLNVGQMTGNYGGQRTLQGQSFDWQKNMDVADRTGYIGGGNPFGSGGNGGMGQRTLQGQQFDRGVVESDRNFNRGVYESDRDFDFKKAQTEWENNFNKAQFDESKAAAIWERAFKQKSFAEDVKQAAASRGLQWSSLGQRQKEFIADSAFREKQFKLEQDKFDFSKNKPGNVSYDQTPEWMSEIAEINNDPEGTYDFLLKNSGTYIQQYSDKGYQELLSRAKALKDGQ